ncbi:Flagellar hook-length control protein FliK [compost metagenome]
MAGINIGRNLNPNPDIRTGSQGGAQSAPRVTGPTAPSLEQAAKERPAGPQFFGYHNDASIAARLAQQGIAPNPVNLRLAQQMLRYGIPLSADALNHFRQMWQGMGSASLVELEALLALFTQGIEAGPQNVAAMAQLLNGGPMSHLLAQLTMALKNQETLTPQLQEIRAQLNAFWKLGTGPEQLGAELAQFQQLKQQLSRMLSNLDPAKVPSELINELSQLKDLLHAQKMLVKDPQNAVYVPFYQWRDQQPMPGELLVETEDNPSFQAAGFAQVTLAVETRNLGRMTISFTTVRGHLTVKLEVQDTPTKQFLERGLPDLRHRLTFRTPYQVATIMCLPTGQERATSVLLPKRRDLRKLGRAIGVI